jgi:hypothetical protein
VSQKKSSRRSPKRRSRPKKSKKPYRIRNWHEYNAALVQRGSLTVWVEEAALAGWLEQERSGRRGASATYSDTAITVALLVKALYRLPLRAAQGLLGSWFNALKLELPVPHYSTVCRRQATVEVVMPEPLHSRREPLHLVVDSTGCKVYGEGEWKVRQHGWGKRRTWRKLHIGVDEHTGEILAVALSSNNASDGEMLPSLLAQVEEPLSQVSADGSYDQRRCYQALQQRQNDQEQALHVTIPPRQGARIWQHGNSKRERIARDLNLRRIRQVGRTRWKQESGYHRRSLAETTMSRYKRSFGERMHARDFPRQARESFVNCVALNRMAQLGRPHSYTL